VVQNICLGASQEEPVYRAQCTTHHQERSQHLLYIGNALTSGRGTQDRGYKRGSTAAAGGSNASFASSMMGEVERSQRRGEDEGDQLQQQLSIGGRR